MAERKPAKKPAKSITPTKKRYEGFTDANAFRASDRCPMV